MKKFYYLSSCSTCLPYVKEIGVSNDWYIQDIKKEALSEELLDAIKAQTGSYESFFSKKAMKYKELGLKDKSLTEADFKKLMLSEYTFIQRPIIEIDQNYYIGNSKNTVAKVIEVLGAK